MYANLMTNNVVKLSNTESLELFKAKIKSYKALIDADIESYSKDFEAQSSEQFGENSRRASSAFTELLSRGGKRIRGGLTMLAYEMFGGTDKDVAITAARVIEMLQAYVLIIDDIADRSPSRRGGPSAHILLKEWHEKHHLKDDSQHFGESIATLAAMLGSHAAIALVSDINVQAEYKVNALRTLNQNLMVTAHGQFNDIFNEVLESDEEQSIENVLVWKTAYYTFISPLQFGAELAGVGNGKLETLAQYGLHAGRAFQIGDDIVGTFSKEQESGKSPHDDIREGKRTLLIAYALKKSGKADAHFLRQCLGKQDLTSAEFERAKTIIKDSGALEHALKEAQKSADAACAVLAIQTEGWDAESVEFLRQLVQYLVIRKS
jgi:geranylgeranyl diphosphate synthase type I